MIAQGTCVQNKSDRLAACVQGKESSAQSEGFAVITESLKRSRGHLGKPACRKSLCLGDSVPASATASELSALCAGPWSIGDLTFGLLVLAGEAALSMRCSS